MSLSRTRTSSSLLVQSQRSYSSKFYFISQIIFTYMHMNIETEINGIISAYLRKSLRPNSAEFFFMTLHDFTTRASCSSVNTIFPSLSIIFQKLNDLVYNSLFCKINCDLTPMREMSSIYRF